MLKRLELVGFKSFAEKTRFDFPPGVTAIVGPNGSGKSNVVDAVRWILGEQSAKSLRGGEMADVIFNGSSSRKSLGLAEVTMTFDNQRRTLATDAEEVQITRRVYRDGTGEYLINNQIARLKDIKELFLGSGAGAGAYCIIEQGRVDALLQASTRDRRVIFEEAAGISRVKAKKLETLRKLERVEQNLQRLNDVLGEVNKQLGRLRLDASKARRYEEYSARLRELRVGLGLREYHQLTGQLRAESEALAGLRSGLSEAQLQAEAWEAEAGRLEQTLARVEALLAEESARLAAVWQQITTQESALSHERSKVAELDAELAETRRKWVTLAYHVRELEDSTARTREEVAEVAAQAEGQRQRVEELAAGLAATDASLAELGRQVQADRVAQVDLVRQAGTLQTQADGLRAQLERQQRDLGQRRARVSQKATELASLDAMLDHLSQADADLQHRIGGARQSLGERVREREGLRQQAEAFQQTLGDLQVRRSDLCGRIDVLEGLERSQEGLGTGVREVMQLLEAERAGERSTADARLSEVVLGLVADFLTVPREVAPLIDLALGDAAQRFVVRDADRLDAALRARAEPFGGRVGFVPAGEPSRVRNAECGVRNEKTIPPSEVPAQAGSLFRIPHSALGKVLPPPHGSPATTPNLPPCPGSCSAPR